jgi:hypothetical protein
LGDVSATKRTAPLPGAWDSAALLCKAQRYIEEMQEYSHSDWKAVLWSSLALELLARAALAKFSPALLADATSWHNLSYALGYTPKVTKFLPKSIATADVLMRLNELLPDFDEELRKFCLIHAGNRNTELHSAEMPFDGASSSTWLPSFYRSCEVLGKSLGASLKDLFGHHEALAAAKVMAAAKDAAANSVKGSINAHKTVWDSKSEQERAKLAAQAEVWARRQDGHVVDCPACASKALLYGDPITEPKKTIKNDLITETQTCLPTRFECVACNLKISGLSQLAASGLGDPFKKAFTYDAADYYKVEDDMSGYEDDNNEPV